MLLSGLGVVALIVVTVLSNVLANEVTHVSKGTSVDEDNHALIGTDKIAVKTGQVKSFTFLLDLPQFDIATLDSVKTLTLLLSKTENKTVTSTWEASFSVASVMKNHGYPMG